VKSYAVAAAAEEFVVTNKAMAILATLLVLGGGAAWYWWGRSAPPPEPEAPVAAAPPAAPVPQIQNPLPPANGTGLPALAQSDESFRAAVTNLPGARALADFLRPENLIRHIVATVDNLPRHKLAVEMRPLESASGSLIVSGGDQQATLDDRNSSRYAALTAIIGALDMQSVNGLYRRYYPLFQRAYEDLGYPNGYFNDRVVEVIDHLLAAPHPSGPPALVRPKVFWEFADPKLEALSSGQKLMLRIGAANQAVIERQLRELRGLIAASRPRR
jgi:hypothetical protein